jgi:hypothetical protein
LQDIAAVPFGDLAALEKELRTKRFATRAIAVGGGDQRAVGVGDLTQSREQGWGDEQTCL